MYDRQCQEIAVLVLTKLIIPYKGCSGQKGWKLRQVFKMILARWRSQPIKSRNMEIWSIRWWAQGISLKINLRTYFLCLWLLLFPKFSQNLWASLNLVCLSFPCSFNVPFVRFLWELLELCGDDVKPESDPQEYSSNVTRKALFFFFFRRPQIEELDEETFPDKSPSDFDDGTD